MAWRFADRQRMRGAWCVSVFVRVRRRANSGVGWPLGTVHRLIHKNEASSACVRKIVNVIATRTEASLLVWGVPTVSTYPCDPCVCGGVYLYRSTSDKHRPRHVAGWCGGGAILYN